MFALGLAACSSGAGNGGGVATGGGGGFGNFGGTGAAGAGTGTGGSGAVGAQGGSAGTGGGTPICAPGLPTAFAAVPASLSLPAARCGVTFDALGKSTGALHYALMDLAADGVPDLVVHKDDCDPDLGHARWDVYAGSASGIAQSPAAYSLPAARCGVAFDRLAQSSGALEYALLDATGDGVADLVVHQDDCDATLGGTHWDVYAGSASGFAPTPAPLSLPAARCGVAWDELGRATGALEYSLMDLSGDGFADLVVYQDDCDAAIGQARWDVYAGSAGGFAASPTAYTLPAARCAVSWDKPARSTGALKYSLLDLSGDKRSDLVVLRDDCDAPVGQSRWDVYAGSAAGFAAAPSPHTLPAMRCAAPWDAASQTYGAVHYSLLDASCDGFPDLIVTRDDCDSLVGQSRWDVYPGSATGLAQAAANITLPAPRCGASFDATVKSSGALHFGVFAWSATDHPSLLVTRDSCDATVGAAHWDYYAAQ